MVVLLIPQLPSQVERETAQVGLNSARKPSYLWGNKELLNTVAYKWHVLVPLKAVTLSEVIIR